MCSNAVIGQYKYYEKLEPSANCQAISSESFGGVDFKPLENYNFWLKVGLSVKRQLM